MFNRKVFLFLFVGFISMKAQKIAEFDVNIPNENFKSEFPVSIALSKITNLDEDKLSLVYIHNSDKKEVPFQIKNDDERYLYWIINPEQNVNKYKFQLLEKPSNKKVKNIEKLKKEGKLTFVKEDKKLLSYQYETIYPPQGIDTNYKRSAFIHPLYSPHGQILTQIQPEDHYHHYGIWNPWTHVLFEADTVDFWNLAKHQGTVKFGDFISTVEGPIFSEFKALHKHIVFKDNDKERVAFNELQTIRIYNTNNSEEYIVDMISELNCATESPVKLLKYRYGGLGWRATEKWDKYNSEVLTSEGKTRIDADGSLAKWFFVQGGIDNDYAGILMMSYPTNYNHPEPVRIWPIPEEKRGDVFANFSPTKNMDWELLPGKTYVLKYRFLVFNGKMTIEKAESAWKNYAKEYLINIQN
ncbi:MAG: PmoA family protein [Ignavibacteriales bacterium]|nr:PmoA family protein [Ignavibacteriales bacterium]